MEWPISTSEAARRTGVTPQVASILIRTHQIKTERLQGVARFVGLMPEAFAQLSEFAKPFASNRRTLLNPVRQEAKPR